VLEKVRETMTKEGYKVVPSKIVGLLQLKVETAFIERLESLGVTINTVPLDPCRDRFYAQLRWIHSDLVHRERYVKTAWKSWKRWRAWQMRPRRRFRATLEEAEPFNLIE
jgi:uridine phosphorylase